MLVLGCAVMPIFQTIEGFELWVSWNLPLQSEDFKSVNPRAEIRTQFIFIECMLLFHIPLTTSAESKPSIIYFTETISVAHNTSRKFSIIVISDTCAMFQSANNLLHLIPSMNLVDAHRLCLLMSQYHTQVITLLASLSVTYTVQTDATPIIYILKLSKILRKDDFKILMVSYYSKTKTLKKNCWLEWQLTSIY